MSKIDAKLLKKMIKEMIEEETNSVKLHPHELEKLDLLANSEKIDEASFLRKLAPYALAGAASMGLGGKAMAKDYDPIKAAGGETRTAAQMFGTTKLDPVKQGKYVIVTIMDTKTNTESRVSFDNDGRPIHEIENQVVNYLNRKPGNTGRFMVNKESVVTDNDDTTVGKGGGAKSDTAKPGKVEVKTNEDGTITGTMSFTGDISNAERLVGTIVDNILQQNPGVSKSSIQYVGSRQINMNKDGKGGTVSQTIKINKKVDVKENKVNKNLLRKLIIEQLEECGMMPEEHSEEGELPSEVSSIEVDPDGYEGFMAKGNLYKMGKSATELHNMIVDEENLEPWVQEKIAVAARMIDDVADYMEYAKMSKKA